MRFGFAIIVAWFGLVTSAFADSITLSVSPSANGRAVTMRVTTPGSCADGLLILLDPGAAQRFTASDGYLFDMNQWVRTAVQRASCPPDTRIIAAYSPSGEDVWINDGQAYRSVRDLTLGFGNSDLYDDASIAQVSRRFALACTPFPGNDRHSQAQNAIIATLCARGGERVAEQVQRRANSTQTDAVHWRQLAAALPSTQSVEEDPAHVATLLARASAAERPADLTAIVTEYVGRYGAGAATDREQDGRPLGARQRDFQRRIATAAAGSVRRMERPKLWMFEQTFEDRPESLWRQSPGEAEGARAAPTDTELGLALLRSIARGSAVGLASARIEPPATVIAGLGTSGPQAVRFVIHHVRKRSCTPAGRRFRCTAQLWAEYQFNEIQQDAIMRMPPAILRNSVYGQALQIGVRPIEIDEVFEATSEGWRAPELEARISNASLANQEGVVAGLRLTAQSYQCITRQMMNDPSANTDPNC